jgi:voltage-gated potassium channel
MSERKLQEKNHSSVKIVMGKFERPMLILSFAWLIITFTELVNGMNPVLSWLGTSIWVAFILFFLIRVFTTAHPRSFMKANWLFLVALLVSILRFIPFLQTFTLARALTATFGLQVLWIFVSADFGLRTLRRAMDRRGAGYAIALTPLVVAAGSAGMLNLERGAPDVQGIHTYPKALWWTAMQITNIGSGYRPVTAGGQMLCPGISICAAAMFGYLTAILATLFVGRDAKDPGSEIAGQRSVQELQQEIVLLRKSNDEVLTYVQRERAPTLVS